LLRNAQVCTLVCWNKGLFWVYTIKFLIQSARNYIYLGYLLSLLSCTSFSLIFVFSNWIIFYPCCARGIWCPYFKISVITAHFLHSFTKHLQIVLGREILYVLHAMPTKSLELIRRIRCLIAQPAMEGVWLLIEMGLTQCKLFFPLPYQVMLHR